MNTARCASEQRHDHRYPVRLAVTLLRRSGHHALTASDVSYRGLFIEGTDFPPLRELVKLSIVLPHTGEQLVVHGMVVHQVLPGNAAGRPAGVGVQLYAMDQEARSIWGGFVLHTREQQSGAPARKLRIVGVAAVRDAGVTGAAMAR